MCSILKVSRSGFYEGQDHSPSPTVERQQKIACEIASVFEEHRGKAGYRKVQEHLVRDRKMPCAKETVRKIMREKGLFFKAKRKFIRTTESDPGLPVAENSLDRNFQAAAPHQKWVADITYLPTQQGWVYLAIVLDLFSRKIVGWALRDHLKKELVQEAFQMAFWTRKPEGDLLHHSDRGCQYASNDFRSELALLGVICSMSRKGNCWDNAVGERFFWSLKMEELGDAIYSDLAHARNAVFDYIELYYNRKRRHQALGYLTPEEFEKRFWFEKKASLNYA